MVVEPGWISIKEALAYVTSVFQSPITAERRFRDVLERDELPAKAEKIIHQRNTPTIELGNHQVEGDSGWIPPFREESGPGWVPHHAWTYAIVDWSENSFKRPAMPVYGLGARSAMAFQYPILDEYQVSGVSVPRAQLQYLFPTEATHPNEDRKLPTRTRTGRPRGTGFQKADAPLIAKMREHVLNGCRSPTAAAWKIIGRDGLGAPGTASPESKVRRLVGGYKRKYGD